ncbi:PilT protein domain-containing protein [Natronorubrum tibetense GA33]|uniref:PilT protein domain-containing protein n=1 Tax=Natronorubrum tibetense GA33 TaxID=1114856 RepID=L9VL66_9EURY|nr:PilT protein domain-containing protein [Natronorubrum tibetense GA33]
MVLGRGGASVGIDLLFDEYWLDLTRYEAANAVWKIGVARDELRDSEIEEAIDILDRLEREMGFAVATGSETIDVAQETGLTFYDASYLAVAQREELTLVTEDGPLRDAADGQGVSTAQVRTLE